MIKQLVMAPEAHEACFTVMIGPCVISHEMLPVELLATLAQELQVPYFRLRILIKAQVEKSGAARDREVEGPYFSGSNL